MNNSKYNCCCGMGFQTERGYKFHLSRCDCGRTIDLCKMERMRSPIIDIFLDNLFISTQSLFIEDNFDRFSKFFKECFVRLERPDFSFYIKELKKNGIVLVKGHQDLSLRKDDDDYVSYEWSNISGVDFFNYIIPYLNERIENMCEKNNLIGYNVLKVDNVYQYLRELRKLAK